MNPEEELLRAEGQLLFEVEHRKLTKEEIDCVVNKVRAFRNQAGSDLYSWVATLGATGATEYKELIESFLDYTSDPEVAEIAFAILTRDWGFVKDYILELKSFLNGVDWDKEGALRMSAVTSAKNYLAKYEDQELCNTLIKIIEDPNEDSTLRHHAYFSLPEAMRTGLKYALPQMTKGERVSSEVFIESLGDLLEEAKWGKLTQEELDYVVNRIKESQNQKDPDLYRLIFIVGKAEAVEHRKLLESFLYYPSNPSIAYIAFSALVNYMDLLGEYVKEVKLFLKGVTWDEYGEVRRAAIGAAGRYLTGFDDKELLEELIHIILDPDEEDMERNCAYSALEDAMEWDITKKYGTEKTDYSILDEAKLRLARCK